MLSRGSFNYVRIALQFSFVIVFFFFYSSSFYALLFVYFPLMLLYPSFFKKVYSFLSLKLFRSERMEADPFCKNSGCIFLNQCKTDSVFFMKKKAY